MLQKMTNAPRVLTDHSWNTLMRDALGIVGYKVLYILEHCFERNYCIYPLIIKLPLYILGIKYRFCKDRIDIKLKSLQ